MVVFKTFVMNLTKTFPALLAAFFALPLFGANLYIQYDPQCMNRLEYTDAGSDEGAPYVVYQIEVNEAEKIMLQVGLESQRYQSYLPTNAINCSNAVFSKEMADKINNQIDQVYLVYQQGRKQYFVSPVSYAAYFVHTDEQISYTSPQHQFKLNLKRGIIGENIAANRQRAEVYFDGRLENQCSGAYVFRQFSLYTSSPHTDIIIVPEVGVVEVREGRNAEDALQNIRRLNKVNNLFLGEYMDLVCLDIQPETITKTGRSSVYEPQPDPQLTPKGADMQARTPLVPPQKHTVKKGETLFGIAKANSVSLADLRDWNDLENSNLIRPGQRLWLGPPVAATAASDLRPKGVDGLPAPYDIPGTEKFAWGSGANGQSTGAGTEMPYWKEYPSEYIVQPGETISSIARKFGYTETRFRSMNNIGPAEEVKIGQRLITSDCALGYRGATAGDGFAGSEYATDLPPYESKIIPTTDYYSGQRQRPMQTANTTGTTARSGSTLPPFEPYGGNTPSFYATPEGNRIQTSTRTTFGRSPTSTTEGRRSTATPYGDRPAEYSDEPLDMSTLPQGYDRIESGSTRANRTVHFVKEGQTLYDIARLYGASVERLRELNNLDVGEAVLPFQQIYVN